MKKFLISGCSSGLGHFLHQHLDSDRYERNQDNQPLIARMTQPYTAIIHCAFNAKNKITTTELYDYIQDNILLTQDLLAIPHRLFIFISTTDVYPKNLLQAHEDLDLCVDEVSNIYGVAKLMAESFVRKLAKNFLIIRPTAMLGPKIRKNSLLKIIYDAQPKLTLSAHSQFNFILHADVLNFIEIAVQKNLLGTFNLAANANVQLADISAWQKKPVTFGDFYYNVSTVSNHKAKEHCPNLALTSLQNIKRFLTSYEYQSC